MTSETKKLIESVTIFSQHDVSCSGGLTEWVNKSDFDRVVEELTKQIELEREKAMRFAEWTHSEFCAFVTIANGKWVRTTQSNINEYTIDEVYASPKFENYLNGLPDGIKS